MLCKDNVDGRRHDANHVRTPDRSRPARRVRLHLTILKARRQYNVNERNHSLL